MREPLSDHRLFMDASLQRWEHSWICPHSRFQGSGLHCKTPQGWGWCPLICSCMNIFQGGVFMLALSFVNYSHLSDGYHDASRRSSCKQCSPRPIVNPRSSLELLVFWESQTFFSVLLLTMHITVLLPNYSRYPKQVFCSVWFLWCPATLLGFQLGC